MKRNTAEKPNRAQEATHGDAKQGRASGTRQRSQTGHGKPHNGEKPNRAREAKHAREGFLAFCLFGFLLFWFLLVSAGIMRNDIN